MKHFEAAKYSDGINRRQLICRKVNDNIIPLVDSLNLDDPINHQLFHRDFGDFLEAKIKIPIINELRETGLKNEKIIMKQVSEATTREMAIIEDIQLSMSELWRESALTGIDLYDMANQGSIKMDNGKAVVCEEWKKSFLKDCTHEPVTESQKQFASNVEAFVKLYNDLKEQLPQTTPVFKNENFIDSLFEIRQGKIETHNYIIQSIK